MSVAHTVDQLLRAPGVQEALRDVDALVAPVVEHTLELSRIPSPTFAEGDKARHALAAMSDLDLRDVHLDAVGNVLGRRPGRGGAGAVVLVAHIDTVFPIGTELTARIDGGMLRGPSVGDNSLGVAAMLALPGILDRAGVRTEQDILLAANVCEEGLGDLRGMREIMRTHAGEIQAVIAIEGQTLGRVTHRAVGSRRQRITVTGPGGHSWGDFGRPSAIHVLAAIVEQITHLPVPKTPRSSFNVGVIGGGVSINTIAPTASCEVDLRSEGQAELEGLVDWVGGVLARRQPRDVKVTTEPIGDRPAGSVPVDAPIVALSCAVLRSLGIEPTLDASSTDANIPISLGVPAVCLGVSRGGGAHRLDEYVEIEPIGAGVRQLLLTTLALAGLRD
ncbi:MAG: M20/M25/M40 family metallo-hydrolase [Chloroflexi bacterium]|nr:M20/M25/M40 family metallo-hydrolase [Chloroflexota bacterium]